LVFLVVSFSLVFLPLTYMHSSPPICATPPHLPHPHWLDNSNYTWWRVQIMQFLIMQFSTLLSLHPSSVHIVLSILFSNTLSLCSSLIVRHQVSHPYRTTGKIKVLDILIFRLFDSKQKETVLGWMVASITWVQSPLNFILKQILMLLLIPKYLNCDIFLIICYFSIPILVINHLLALNHFE
jgi:hypothetical protein